MQVSKAEARIDCSTSEDQGSQRQRLCTAVGMLRDDQQAQGVRSTCVRFKAKMCRKVLKDCKEVRQML